MDAIANFINENWRFIAVCMTVLGFAGLWWLSRYFASKKDFLAHLKDYKEHKAEHYQLRDLVREIDSHVKHLPTAEQSQALRLQMARLEGRLESVEPMFKQILNQYNMLLENELRGEKK